MTVDYIDNYLKEMCYPKRYDMLSLVILKGIFTHIEKDMDYINYKITHKPCKLYDTINCRNVNLLHYSMLLVYKLYIFNINLYQPRIY